MEHKLNILIADDHPIVREGLVHTIEKKPEFKIAAQCRDGNEALKKIIEIKPDIAVLDISMPGLSGLEIIKQLDMKNLHTKFIILTMYQDEEYFNAAMSLNVKGYLLKDNALAEIVNCLKAAAEGRHYICPAISEHLINWNSKKQELRKDNPSLEKLTPAEKQILKRIADNKTSKEIAEELYISVRTVQNHRNSICQKLEIQGHNKLLQFALENRELLQQ